MFQDPTSRDYHVTCEGDGCALFHDDDVLKNPPLHHVAIVYTLCFIECIHLCF